MNNNMDHYEPKVGFLYSKPIIYLTLLIFWPLSLFFMLGRAKRDRKLTFTLGFVILFMGLITAGIVLLLIIGLDTLSFIKYGIFSWSIVYQFFFFIGSIVFCILGIRLMSWGRRIKSYLNLIVNQQISSIPQIAVKINLPELKVIDDLKEMVKRHFLPNAQIDEARKTITVKAVEEQIRYQKEVLQQERPTASEVIEKAPSTSASPQVARAQMLGCKCCGANNLVWPNRDPLCEFCGAIVN